MKTVLKLKDTTDIDSRNSGFPLKNICSAGTKGERGKETGPRSHTGIIKLT